MKRCLDIVIAATGLVIALPVMAVVALLVALNLGRPVLFTQRRPGLHGELFEMIKFRTMRNACDSTGQALPDAQRLTRFGIWLRRTSLDELPELWNVLTGDMSLVGPRPLLPEYLPLYSGEQMRRHEVRPGITGWAQVNGRNATAWPERLAMDVWYVDHQNLWLDLRILAMTLGTVAGGRGVCHGSEATMHRFTGEHNIESSN
jgi:sugar transferase EpsL